MNDSQDAPPRSAEERIAELFREAGHEVQQVVGLTPGTIDWFVIPQSGFVRPRTYFRVLPGCPESIEATLAELETARVARTADRAMAIVMDGRLPTGYAPDLLHRTANVLTFRRWLLEVSRIAEQVRTFAREYEERRMHTLYLPRRARLKSGEEVQFEPYIDAWMEQSERPPLVIEGASSGGKTRAIAHMMYRAAVRFTRDPEAATPVMRINHIPSSGMVRLALDAGSFIPVMTTALARMFASSIRLRGLLESDQPNLVPYLGDDIIYLQLIPPSADEVTLWMCDRVGDPKQAEMLARARSYSRDFRDLSDTLQIINLIFETICRQATKELPASVDQWIASVVMGYVEAVERTTPGARAKSSLADVAQSLEDRALNEFAVGTPLERSWFARGSLSFPESTHTWFDFKAGRFKNDLLRDYFLARKLAREVEAGNTEIVLRYQFPPFVFLFLANLAPEVAAKVTLGKVARLEEAMQEEVERKLQLTFAHLLNRPVGMIRAHLNEIRDGIGKEKATELGRPFDKIEAEIDYIHGLAERTRLWQSKPEEPIVPVPLRLLIEEVAQLLHEQHAAVAICIDIADEIRVHGMRDALREVLQCLLENAFHAAPTDNPGLTPGVTVVTRMIGEVLRVEVRDTGLGVPPEDRDRIFEPLVTTKKGGTGKPRGTGLGLPIARRFAEHMGGRVGLDAEPNETCFFVDLVPWRESV